MAADVSYTVAAGGAVYAGRLAPGAAAVASFAAQLASMTGSLSVAGPAPAPPPATPFLVARTGTRYATLAQAVAGAISGDTIKVAAGTYTIPTGAAATTAPGFTEADINLATLTIEWETPGTQPVIDLSAWATVKGNSGGRPVGINAGPSNRTLTVRGLVLLGAKNGDSYGINSEAGYPSGNPTSTLTIEYCKLLNWADGVKTTYTNTDLSVNLRYSTVEDCSAGSQTHGVYVQGNTLDALGCTFRTTVAGNPTGAAFLGHLIKSRMRVTKVRGCLFDAKGGGASCIEAPNGGDLEVYGNILLKYNVGDPSNPPIKFGFEEYSTYLDVTVSGAAFEVGNLLVGQTSGATGTIVAIQDGGTRLVYRPTSGGTRFDNPGENILVGGVVRGVQVGARGGSIDGTSFDGRTHRVRIAQNTVRNEQASGWSGSTSTAVGMLWISPNMTDDNNSAISNASILAAGFVRNNIVGDIGTGNRTVANISPEPQYAENSPVEGATISTTGTLGAYSGTPIAGSPSSADAAYAYAGEYTPPLARTDTFRGGRIAGIPTWRVGQAANTWRTVSSSKISSVDPAASATYNPAGAGNPSPWRGSDGQKAVIDAWGSAVWDEDNLKLWIPIGGGHGNYAGNECYMQPLADASPQWTMPRPPSGAVGNTITVDDGQELTGTYIGDGRPRSIHPYSNLCYVPGVGSVITRISAPYLDSNKGTDFVFALHPTTGETRLVFNFANTSMTGAPSGAQGGNLGSACCYDPVRNRVVSIGIGGSCRLLWCTPSATPGTWSGGSLAATAFVSGGSVIALVYVPTVDRYLAITHFLGVLEHKLIHPTTGVLTDLGSLSGFATGYQYGNGGAPGAAWSPELGKVLLWNNTSNASQISTLTPHASTPLTSAWTPGALTVSGANAVNPPPQAGNGTHGLFGYSSRLRGCYLIVPDNLGGTETYFYATEAIG